MPVQLLAQLVLSDQRETLCALFLGQHLWAELRGEADVADALPRDADLVQRAILRDYEDSR